MSRAPPNGAPPNGYPPQLASNTAAMSSQTRPGNMSRAERFEDEKRRIIESCFSKLDQNGQLAESYITHIRVQEDAAHPSTPPPPDSSQDSKKPRLIIIAVRSTGRVRMHKARENNNGSFSIGKTWNLEELSAIESFSNISAPPQSDKEAQYRAWAGSVGFIVTITKPYYWQAGTAKEKEFFIASAVKIYRKYTKGQAPELRGFDEAQKASMLGTLPGQQPPPQEPPQGPPQGPPPSQARPPQREASESPRPPQPPFAKRPQSREDSRYRASPGPPPSMSDRSGAGSRNESPVRFAPPLSPPVPKPYASTEQLRSQSREGFRQPDSRPSTSGQGSYPRSPPPNFSQMHRAPSAQSSNSQLRSESPANSFVSSAREGVPRSQLGPSSPPRKPSYQQSIDSVTEDRQIPKSPPPPNGVTGASLFQASQQRWAEQRQQDQSPVQTPQLPPIETAQPPNTRSQQQPASADREPKTAESKISSPAMDAGDAAAFAAMPEFMGPEHSSAGSPPVLNGAPSPPTPEKSIRRPRRPTLEGTQSDNTLELRPAPSNRPNQIQRSMTPDGGSIPVLPRVATAPLPLAEESSNLRPVSPTKTEATSNLDIPGAFPHVPPGPSPLGTPAETSGEERKEVEAKEGEGDYRPGLGPMIKKKAVADRFKKAATAANAFKPRPGGAAEKIMKAKSDRDGTGEPDGITAVVPRPAPRIEQTKSEQIKEEVTRETPSAKQVDDLAVKEPVSEQPPKVEVSSPISPARGLSEQSFGGMDGTKGVQLQDEPPRLQTPDQQTRQEEQEEKRTEQRPVRQPQIKVKRRSAQQEQYIAELGIERSLLADKCLDFEIMLHDFGWNDAALSPKALTEMEANLRREQARLEAGSWLSAPSHETSLREERERQVLGLLDKAIQECDEMDGLLTIYNVELNSLNDDIAYIEAQSQGLQVQAANQRLLHTELRNLVDTISLDRKTLEPLRYADLSDSHGIGDAEGRLVKLYQALVTIDPNIRSSSSGRPKSRGGMTEGNELSSMAAVRQKRDAYGQESDKFCQRLMQTLEFAFTSSFSGVKGKLLVPVSGSTGMMRLNTDAYPEVRKRLWVYGPLILFTKELNQPAWQTILRMYHSRAKLLYADAFGQNVAYWKRSLRKSTGEEADILFTTQEKEDVTGGGSALSSARKLTVKRSQTLAKTLRSASGEKHSPTESRSTGSLSYCEIFNGAMDEMGLLVSYEQNFVVDLFHATSLETGDFMDIVAATPPNERYGTNVAQQKPLDPDREMARTVTGAMGEIFSSFTNELSSLLDWSISTDPIQGIGVMATLSKHQYHLQDSSQEFLLQLIETLKGRLENMFAKFVEEQVRAIEDTKVKIKKRKGVIAFMKVFPHFALAVENTFASIGGADYDRDAASMQDVRARVDEAYNRINRAMFDSLKVIAKESPSTATQAPRTGTDDPEDKEMLNYHVLIIENMNHYVTEVDDGGKQGVLAEWKGRAEMERMEAMNSYVGQVIRRPLGKVLEFLDSIDSMRESHSTNPSNITSRPTYSRKAARNLLSQWDGKELRRGIDQLRARIDKHFGHGDDEAKCRELVSLVCKESERAYEKTVTRIEDMIGELYPNMEGEKTVEMEFSRADMQAGFRR